MDSETSSISDEGEEDSEEIAADDLQAAVDAENDETENDPLPDISVHCKECKKLIAVQFLREHRSYHNALSTLGYTSQKTPKCLSALLRRRISLAQGWKSEAVTNTKAFSELQRIDDACELLKSYLDDTYDQRFVTGRNRVSLDCGAVGLSCSAHCILAAGICWSQNPRWKNVMEDTRVFQDYYGNDISKCFLAIYDGHNGRYAADVAANDLHHYLLKEMTRFDPSTSCTCAVNLVDVNDLSDYPLDRAKPVVRKGSIRHILHEESANILQQIMHTCPDSLEELETEEPKANEPGTDEAETRIHKTRDPYTEKMMQAFKRAFMVTDYALSFGVQEESRVRWSGCSALACMMMDKDSGKCHPDGENDRETHDESQEDSIIHLGDIYIANAGNVHAVLSRGGAVHQLSSDHSPANATEKQRLLKAGVSIHVGGQNGKVNGILEATRGLGNHGDPLLKSAILCDPYTVNTKIDQFAEFLILASNGLWEALTNEEAVEVVQAGIELERREIKQRESEMGRVSELQRTEHAGLESQHDECQEVESGTTGVTKEQMGIDGQDREGIYRLVTAGSDRSKIISGDEGQILEEGDTGQQTSDQGDPTSKDDACRKIEFEKMIRSLVGNEGEDKADMDTVAKVQGIYAKSHLNVLQSREERIRSMAEKASERLVQAAILAGARDNITVMVIFLPGCVANADDM